jgi:hypothetical protein
MNVLVNSTISVTGCDFSVIEDVDFEEEGSRLDSPAQNLRIFWNWIFFGFVVGIRVALVIASMVFVA